MTRIISMYMLMLTAFSIQAQDQICDQEIMWDGGTIEISAQAMSFTPDAMIANVGWSVGWVNFGGIHDVNGISSSITGLSFGNPEEFYLPTIEVDSVPECIGTHIFTVPGVYYYDCTTYGHAGSGMIGTIIVHLPGCTDPLACNFDAAATQDNESCLFIVDDCDDGDENTVDDFIQENCECAGTPISTVDELEALSVLIYPNPASNNLTVDLGDLNGVNTTIKLYDSSSKLVFEKQSSSTLMIDVSGVAKGMYSLELSTDEQVLRRQVVVE